MIYHVPKRLPSFTAMAREIVGLSNDKAAEYLGVTLKTYLRWLATDKAPRSAQVALFWITRHGVSLHDCDVHNTRRTLHARLRNLAETNAALCKRIQQQEDAAVFAAANMPFFSIERPCQPIEDTPHFWPISVTG